MQVYCFDWWLLITINLIIWSNFLRYVFIYTQLKYENFSAKAIIVVLKLGLTHICNVNTFYFCLSQCFQCLKRIALVHLRADVIWHLNRRTATGVCVLYWLFTKICIFSWWTECVEILKLLYVKEVVIYLLYTKKIQYSTMLLICRL